MLTIRHSIKTGNGFTIRASDPGSGLRGWSVEARDLDEVLAAVAHYHGRHGTRGCEAFAGCPLCRKRADRTA